MDREKTKEAIKVMSAFVDGAQIECSSWGGHWESFSPGVNPAWNWWTSEYRVKTICHQENVQ